MYPLASMTSSGKHLKLSQTCEPDKILINGFATGECDLSLQPKQLNKMHTKLILHKLNAFRAQVNKLRTADGQALIEQGKCV